MVLSTTRVSVLLLVAMVVALGIGLWGAVGSASPKDNDNHSDKGHSSALTVLTKTREARIVDLDPQGPSHGDLRVVNAPLYNESAKERIGRLDLFCVTTDPADEPAEKGHMAECTVTYTLPGGEISQQGVQPFPKLPELPARNVESITGGTGKYAGVRGDVLIEPRGNKVVHTFRFID